MRTTYTIIILIFLITVSCYFTDTNIIKNGSFETQTAGYVAQWNTEAFVNNDQAVRFYISDKEAFEGKKSFGIANIQPNDSKLIQWVNVEPNSLYRLSGWIKAKSITGAKTGANISILGLKVPSEALKETYGEWKYVEIYGKTGNNQHELAVTVRLGFYASLVTGIAYFDTIVLEKISSSPLKRILNFNSTGEKYIELDPPEFDPGDFGITRISDTETLIIVILLLVSSFTAIASGSIFMYVYIVRPFWYKFGKYFFIVRSHDKTAKTDANRRKNSRKQLKMTVTVRHLAQGGKPKEMLFNSLNISLDGVFINVDDLHIFHVGDKIEIEIEAKGKRYHIGKAHVVRLQKEQRRKGTIVAQGIGIRFQTSDETHLKWMISIMGELQKKDIKKQNKKKSISQTRSTPKKKLTSKTRS